MAALSPSEQLRLVLPGAVALLLLLLSALPMALLNLPLTPHVVWLMTLCIGSLYPAAWPVTLAFVLGLLSDFLYGTPLGAQALLSLFLTLFVASQARRASHQLFPIRWLEAAAGLAVLHFLLWLIVGLIAPRPSFSSMALAALINSLWYPIFFFGSRALITLLPTRG